MRAEDSQVTFLPDGRIVLKGEWLRGRNNGAPRLSGRAFLARQHLGGVAVIRLVDGGIGQWDTTLLIFIAMLLKEARTQGIETDITGLPQGIANILRLYKAGSRNADEQKKTGGENNDRMGRKIIQTAGEFGCSVQGIFNSVAGFVGEIILGLWRCLCLKSRMRLTDFLREMLNCGVKALPIIVLISFLMGLIMAFIGSIPLKMFQAEVYVASLVGIGMLRLLSPVMVGIVMAGRTSAAYAAELGTMTVNEEVDALQTMGIPPMDFLVMPRFLAMTLMLPIQCVFADVISILGGAVVAVFYLGISPLAYFETLSSTTRLSDLLVGLVTSFILGVLDSLCGCFQGINCGRNAAAVGQSTTSAVVYSIVCIVMATSLITVLTVILKL